MLLVSSTFAGAEFAEAAFGPLLSSFMRLDVRPMRTVGAGQALDVGIDRVCDDEPAPADLHRDELAAADQLVVRCAADAAEPHSGTGLRDQLLHGSPLGSRSANFTAVMLKVYHRLHVRASPLASARLLANLRGRCYGAAMTGSGQRWSTYLLGEDVGVGVRVAEDGGGGFAITGLYVTAGQIDSSTLRKIPLGRWVSQISTNVGLERALRQLLPNAPQPEKFAELDQMFAAARRSRARIPKASRRPALTRPDGSDPDGFYRAVAGAYREYAGQTKAAGARIADEANVPVTTAHRWVREARRRGFLPPGRQGKTL